MQKTNRLSCCGLLFALLGLTPFLYGSDVLITGCDTGYAGVVLEFYCFDNPFTTERTTIGTVRPGDDGCFSLRMETNATRQIFVDIGIYRAFFYAEPGKEYRLALPPYVRKKTEDAMNPYFRPSLLHMGVIDSEQNDLNRKIMEFEERYRLLFDRMAVLVYRQAGTEALDTLVEQLENDFPPEGNRYFARYRDCRISFLKHLPMMQRGYDWGMKPVPDEAPDLDNPAYTELFTVLFQDIFQKIADRQDNRRHLVQCLEDGNLKGLKGLIRQEMSYENDSLVEVIVLKGLYDLYYNSELPAEKIANVIKILTQDSAIASNRELAVSMHSWITALLPGQVAPEISGKDLSGQEFRLSDLRGTFVYLFFFSVSNYACLKDFVLLDDLQRRYVKELVVLGVSMDRDRTALTDYLSMRPVGWKIIDGVERETVKDQYRLTAYPSYFLVGPDGSLVMSPAPAPMDHFENHLLRYLPSAKER